ncbi:MAG TPA: NRDE family protein [Patescibacteria group bacterium]|nr:NRDE family protein [Patescibacteria group bacterium]
MCTLVVMRNLFPEYPLVIASNRDERPERPSADAEFWSDHPGIFAPRDLVRGGTWIGVAEHGIFVALTNRDCVPHASGRASRGALLVEALHAPNARQAAEFVISAFSKSTYNGFHLVLADQNEMFLLVGHGERLTCDQIQASTTILTAYGIGAKDTPRAREIERRISRLNDSSPNAVNQLLDFHANGNPLAAACVHDPNESHRTVSSMLIRTDASWSAFETWYRRGPACSGPFTKSVRIPISRKRRTP